MRFTTPRKGSRRCSLDAHARDERDESATVGARSTAKSASGTPAGKAALLIDHGGVISTSVADAELRAEFVAHLAALLSRGGSGISPEEVSGMLDAARRRHGEFKRAQLDAAREHSAPIAEVDPVQFWRDFAGAELSEQHRAVLEAEAHDLMFRYGRAKSRRTPRPGIRSLLTLCRDLDMPVVVVSNTVSGRAVRAECREQGLDDLISVYVCSDEVGVRKPDVTIVEEALRAVDAAAERSWFYGDKPQNDAAAAHAAGIARRVIVRGGSTPDDDLASLPDGLVTDLVDGADDLAALISPTTVPDSSPADALIASA